MQKSLTHTVNEFSGLHTGKASPAMVETVSVEAYGSQMKLKEVAAITAPDARTIVIQPWDKGVLNDVQKGIQKANLGLNPVVDGAIVRCPLPDLSRERREELVKIVHAMAEEGKIGIRAARRDAMEALKKSQKDGFISEDELKRAEKDVQKATDQFTADIAKHVEGKEKELMQI